MASFTEEAADQMMNGARAALAQKDEIIKDLRHEIKVLEAKLEAINTIINEESEL